MEGDGDAIPAAPEDLMQMNEAQASGGHVHTFPAAVRVASRNETPRLPKSRKISHRRLFGGI